MAEKTEEAVTIHRRWDSEPGELTRALAGKKVVAAAVQPGNHHLAVLAFAGGGRLELELDGDCCSHSYFVEPAQFGELLGATIQAAEERDGVGVLDPPPRPEEPFYDDQLSPHFLVFTTDKGHVTIDWRNSSNGYYDGSVIWRFVP